MTHSLRWRASISWSSLRFASASLRYRRCQRAALATSNRCLAERGFLTYDLAYVPLTLACSEGVGMHMFRCLRIKGAPGLLLTMTKGSVKLEGGGESFSMGTKGSSGEPSPEHSKYSLLSLSYLSSSLSDS